MTFQATVLTLFPDLFPGPLAASLIGRGLEKGLWQLDTINIRAYATDKHRTVDDTPFGGGPGMVMRPDILDAALHASAHSPASACPLYVLSPRGEAFSHSLATKLASGPGIRLICGRFEGIDQRVLDKWQVKELSLGDFVLTGGELAAMTILDSTVRLLPGIIGDHHSLLDESFANGLLEYPHYTRPALWEGRAVPAVLQSGHHADIARWRLEQAEKLTKDRRPDLWQEYKRD